MTRDDIGLPYNWRYGPADLPLDDVAFRTEAHAFTGLGLRPYRPVHLKGRRDPGSGDWTINWFRRTRVGGDGWEQEDVPLSEQAELYELEILDGPGGDVLRTVTGLGVPSYDYSAAHQTADFGAPQATVNVRVYQRSATYGRGAPAEALIFV